MTIFAAVLMALPFAAQAQRFHVSIPIIPTRTGGISIGINIPIPGSDYVWIDGYWDWDDYYGDYVWVDGTWARPPQRGWTWVDGYWEYGSRGYAWVSGYWSNPYRTNSYFAATHRNGGGCAPYFIRNHYDRARYTTVYVSGNRQYDRNYYYSGRDYNSHDRVNYIGTYDRARRENRSVSYSREYTRYSNDGRSVSRSSSYERDRNYGGSRVERSATVERSRSNFDEPRTETRTAERSSRTEYGRPRGEDRTVERTSTVTTVPERRSSESRGDYGSSEGRRQTTTTRTVETSRNRPSYEGRSSEVRETRSSSRETRGGSDSSRSSERSEGRRGGGRR